MNTRLGGETRDGDGLVLERRARGSRPETVQLSIDAFRITLAGGRLGPTRDHPVLVALSLSPGRWTPPVAAQRELTVGVVSGALLRTRGQVHELLLQGDMSELDPTGADRWRVLSPSPAVITLLTAGIVAELAAVPGVTQALLRAWSRQRQRGAELRAIMGIYDIEDRIASFFAHLARHIGRSEATGTRIPLRLEQRRVEEILSAGHTQATAAFRSLFGSGVLVHDAAGWLVTSPLPGTTATRTCSAPNTISPDAHGTLPFRSSIA